MRLAIAIGKFVAHAQCTLLRADDLGADRVGEGVGHFRGHGHFYAEGVAGSLILGCLSTISSLRSNTMAASSQVRAICRNIARSWSDRAVLAQSIASSENSCN